MLSFKSPANKLILSLISSHSVTQQNSVLPEDIPCTAKCAPVQNAQSANISLYGVCDIVQKMLLYYDGLTMSLCTNLINKIKKYFH